MALPDGWRRQRSRSLFEPEGGLVTRAGIDAMDVGGIEPRDRRSIGRRQVNAGVPAPAGSVSARPDERRARRRARQLRLEHGDGADVQQLGRPLQIEERRISESSS
jgi:hypothetical protein